MKKIFTLLALSALAINGFAQRTIDLSLQEIVKPTELQTALDGSALSTEFVGELIVKNNGTDSIKTGDSIFFNGWIDDYLEGGTYIQLPANAKAGAAYYQELNRPCASGDTLHIKFTLTINGGLLVSKDVIVNMGVAILNRGSDPITPEQTATQANNRKEVNIPWYNYQGHNVSVEEVSFQNNMNVFPNPAQDEIQIQILQASFLNVQIEIYDLQGKLIIQESNINLFENNCYKLNTSALEEGMYIVRVINGNKVDTAKISIKR